MKRKEIKERRKGKKERTEERKGKNERKETNKGRKNKKFHEGKGDKKERRGSGMVGRKAIKLKGKEMKH